MKLPGYGQDMPMAQADVVENPFERRLLQAWRNLPAKPRVALLELVEAYRGRKRQPP